jgi:hypothetical protein
MTNVIFGHFQNDPKGSILVADKVFKLSTNNHTSIINSLKCYYHTGKGKEVSSAGHTKPSCGSSGHTGDTSPGQTRKKPKDLSVCECEECRRGEGGDTYDMCIR